MYLVREVLHCRPGKVGEMLKKFRVLNGILEQHKARPFRLFTDVAGANFWTLVAESEWEQVGDFLAVEQEVYADPAAQQAMAGYHDFVLEGRREIYRVES